MDELVLLEDQVVGDEAAVASYTVDRKASGGHRDFNFVSIKCLFFC